MENKKVLIFGLDNSGKTSITLSFKKDTNILSYFTLKPTRRVKIEKCETEDSSITIWDFGGQAEYRSQYLEDLNKYLGNVDKIIYVIDIQDINRYDLALEYLKKILEKVKATSDARELSVFLHKYDPQLKDQEFFKDIDEKINNELIPNIRELVPSEFNYEIVKTCIFTTFKKIAV